MSERAGTPVKGCPGCDQDTPPIMIDEDGTLASISGKPGRWGHGIDDYYWFCDDYADSERPSVDWLDGRESCLIDGVRYTRAGSSEVEKLLAKWKRLAHRTRIGEAIEGVPGTYERFAGYLEEAVEADREGRQGGWDECWVRRGHVTGVLHLANKDDPQAVRILVPTDSPEPDKETP